MVAIIAHLVLGFAAIAWVVRANPRVFARPADGPAFSALELVFYASGIAATVLGYYFNHQYMTEYAVPGSNPIWGPGSWQEFIVLGYANSAASSASQDYTIISVILIPLLAIVDGYRRGIRRPWLFAVQILFTSSAFALAFYLAAVERQRRNLKAAKGLDTVPA